MKLQYYNFWTANTLALCLVFLLPKEKVYTVCLLVFFIHIILFNLLHLEELKVKHMIFLFISILNTCFSLYCHFAI